MNRIFAVLTMPKPEPFIHVFEKHFFFYAVCFLRTTELRKLIQPNRIQIFPLWCLSIFISVFLKKDHKRKEYGLALTNALM